MKGMDMGLVDNVEAVEEIITNKVVKKDGKWWVESEKGKNLGGPYDTEEEAKKRLKQVEYFKHTKNQLITLTSKVTPSVRNDRMEDRDWLVVPMVMLVEGVHNGSCGALYYPKEELEKTPVSWNHKPVVVYHPNGPTACDPDVLTNRKVGVIMNTKYEDGKLKAEAWLDPDRIKKIDNRISEAIENKSMMELSTGLFTDLEDVEGDWGSEHFEAIAKNYRPDHLALLPDMVGACSTADGAGFLRLNVEEENVVVIENNIDVTDNYIRIRQKSPSVFKEGTFRRIWISKNQGIDAVIGQLSNPPQGDEGLMVVQSYLFNKEKWEAKEASKWASSHKEKKNVEEVANEVSHGEIWTQLSLLVYKKNSNAWLVEVYDSFFIYCVDGEYFTQKYSIDKDFVSLDGTAQAVIRVVQYKTKDGILVEKTTKNIENTEKGQNMKDELIKKLLENKDSGWVENDKDVLTNMDEKALELLVKKADEAAKNKATVPVEEKPTVNKEEKPADKKEEKPVENKEEPKKPMTEEEYIAAAPKNIQNVLTRGLKAYNSEKERLIGIIKKNPKNSFTDEYLQNRELDELMGLAKLAAPEDKQMEDGSILMADYSGQAEAATANAEVELLDLPVMNFAETK